MSNTNHIRYINPKNAEAVTTYIQTVIADAKTLKDKVQVAAVMILLHVGKHGDKPTAARWANELVNGLGRGFNAKALIDWFQAFGAQLAEDNKSFADWDIAMLKNRFNGGSELPKAIRSGAQGTHWTEFAPDKIWEGFKLDDAVQSVIKKASAAINRAQKENAEDKVEVDPAKFRLLQVLQRMTDSQADAILSQMGEQSANEQEEENHFVTLDVDSVEAKVA